MSIVYSQGDNIADVLNKTAAVMAFLAEFLTEGRGPEEDVVLSAEAVTGLALITQDVRAGLEQAAVNR